MNRKNGLSPASPRLRLTGGGRSGAVWSLLVANALFACAAHDDSQHEDASTHWGRVLELDRLQAERDDVGVLTRWDAFRPGRRTGRSKVFYVDEVWTAGESWHLLAGERDNEGVGPSLEPGDSAWVILRREEEEDLAWAGLRVAVTEVVWIELSHCCWEGPLQDRGWLYHLDPGPDQLKGYPATMIGVDRFETAPSTWDQAPPAVVNRLIALSDSLHAERIRETQRVASADEERHLQYLDRRRTAVEEAIRSSGYRGGLRPPMPFRGPHGRHWAMILPGLDDPWEKGLESTILYLIAEDGSIQFRANTDQSLLLVAADLDGGGLDALVLSRTIVAYDGEGWELHPVLPRIVRH